MLVVRQKKDWNYKTEKFHADKPIYMQLVDRINHQIINGELKSGKRLPAVRDVAILFKVNPNTVQRTFTELERIGSIEIRRGLGAFVTENAEVIRNLRTNYLYNAIGNFVSQVQSLGFNLAETIDKLNEHWTQIHGDSS